MKNLFAIIIMISCSSFVYSQNLEFSDIAGTYEGVMMPGRSSKYKLEIKTDKSFVFSNRSGNLWIGIIEGRLEVEKLYFTKGGTVMYQFFVKDSPQGYTSLAINVLDDAAKKSMKFEGVYVFLNKKGELPLSLDMSRAGGNPMIKQKVVTENLTLKGSTASWGNYQIEYNESINQAGFVFDYFYSLFRVIIEDEYYTITNKLKDQKEVFNIKYRYDKSRGKLLLVETPTLNSFLYSNSEIIHQKKIGSSITDQQSILKALVEQTYALFDEKYKPSNGDFDKYTNELTGRFIVIYNDAGVYIGDLKEGRRHGKGHLILKTEEQIGTWENGNKNGYVKVIADGLKADTYHENGIKVGTWTYTYDNGKVTEVTFKNDKKVSTKEIKSNTTAKKDTYIAPKIAYAAIPKQPFTGKYQGDDLLDLLERHKDDEAIKKWLANPIYAFEEQWRNKDMVSYKGKGIELNFSKEHLTFIKIYQSYPHAYSLPYGVKIGALSSTLTSPWLLDRNNSRRRYTNGISAATTSDETETKIASLQISKKVFPAKQVDIDRNRVGVGLELREKSKRVIVDKVWQEWAADKINITKGDEIIAVNGKYVGGEYASNVEELISGKDGTTVSIKIRQNGQEKICTLQRGYGGEGKTSVQLVGIGLVIKKEAGEKGVYRAVDVTEGWAADKAGIKKGMAITYINGKYLNRTDVTNEDVKKMLEGKTGSSLSIRFGKDVSFSEYKEYKVYRGMGGTAKLTYEEKPKPKVEKPKISPSTNSKKVGIGISYSQGKESEIYEVMWLSTTSAAYKSGVRRFDNLLKINDISITGKDSAFVKNLVEGLPNTSVKVTIERDGKEMDFTFLR